MTNGLGRSDFQFNLDPVQPKLGLDLAQQVEVQPAPGPEPSSVAL